MILKKAKNKALKVKVVNQPLDVGVRAKPFLVPLFEDKEIGPDGHTLGPLGGLDLTGYSEYRLTLFFVGEAGTPFSIREMFGPAGAVDQISFDIGNGQIGPKGVLNYRASFNIFGPKNFFVQILNEGDQSFRVNGTLYAVR